MLWTRVSVAAGETVPVRWTVATDPALADPVAGGVGRRPRRTATTPCTWPCRACGRPRRTGTASASATSAPRSGGPGRCRRPDGPAGPAPARGGVLRPLRHRLLQRLRPPGRTGRRSRRPSRRLHLRGRSQARAVDPLPPAPRPVPHAARLPRPPRPVQDRPRPPGAACPAPDGRRVGRPRTGRQRLVGRRRRARPPDDGDWVRRRAAAVRAYREWVPQVCPTHPIRSGSGARCRSGRWPTWCCSTPAWRAGNGRSPAGGRWSGSGDGTGRCSAPSSGRGWRHARAGAGEGADDERWTLLASQVVVAPIHLLAAGGAVGRRLGAVGGGLIVNSGQWDGYPDERERLLSLLGRRPGAALVLSGDLHSSWVPGWRPTTGGGRRWRPSSPCRRSVLRRSPGRWRRRCGGPGQCWSGRSDGRTPTSPGWTPPPTATCSST